VAKDLLTVTEAAGVLGVSRGRVIQLIAAGRLPAEKYGIQFMLKRGDVKLYKPGKTGRPRKKRVASKKG
jgi:excisionase family DNA binding protein